VRAWRQPSLNKSHKSMQKTAKDLLYIVVFEYWIMNANII
jgi:hypothetical protein